MPTATDVMTHGMPRRVCLYGPAKSRKTTWALMAAEAGYRVLLLDSDRGSDVLVQLSLAARQRVYIFECHDSAEDAYAAAFTTYAFKTFHFWVNEETRRLSFTKLPGLAHVDFRNFGNDTIVVYDSYTALVQSVVKSFCRENSIDLSDAKKTEWPGYGYAAMYLNWFLGQTKLLPCHLIMIGHSTQYEKYKKIPGSDKQGALEWSRRQLKSSSNPHSMGITKEFTDVLYTYVEGRQAYIDTRGNQYEEAGSRTIQPDRYKWEEMSFAALAKAAGVSPPVGVEPFEFTMEPANTPLVSGSGPLPLAITTKSPILIGGRTNSLTSLKLR